MKKKEDITFVILDTNALLIPFKFKIDLEGELLRLLGACEILVPSSVLDELKIIRVKHAKAAQKLAERFRVITTLKKGDESVLSLAKEMNAVVVTNDRELRKALKQSGIKVVFLRNKSYLDMESSVNS